MEHQKTTLIFAVTLTTGIIPHKLSIAEFNNKLQDLLIKYRKHFIDFQFNLEILDTEMMPAKVHYHGWCALAIEDIQLFHKFVGRWRDHKTKIKYHTKIKLIKASKNKTLLEAFDGWKAYISKQEYIYKIGFPSPYIEKYKFTSKNIYSSNELLNWKAKDINDERKRSEKRSIVNIDVIVATTN